MKVKLEWYDTLSSTQEYLISNPSDCIIIAEKQSCGRGRHGGWQTLEGSLLFSFEPYSVLENGKKFSNLYENSNFKKYNGKSIEKPDISYLMVLSALRRTFCYFEIPTLIKWPNDILLTKSNKVYKTTGVLIDYFVIGEEKRCVLGIGINLGFSAIKNRPVEIHIPKDLSEIKVSNIQTKKNKASENEEFKTIYDLTGKSIDPVDFIRVFLHYFYLDRDLDFYNLPDYVRFKDKNVKVIDKKKFKILYNEKIILIDELEWGYDWENNEIVRKK